MTKYTPCLGQSYGHMREYPPKFVPKCLIFLCQIIIVNHCEGLQYFHSRILQFSNKVRISIIILLITSQPLVLVYSIRVFNRNLNRWQNCRSRWRMNYSHRSCEILVVSGGILVVSGGMLPLKILKIWDS